MSEQAEGHVTVTAGANTPIFSLCVFAFAQGRSAADFDEPLRIEEDAHWTTEQT